MPHVRQQAGPLESLKLKTQSAVDVTAASNFNGVLLYDLHSAHLGSDFPAISAPPSGICASSFATEVRRW